jgi:hypothetical protein
VLSRDSFLEPSMSITFPLPKRITKSTLSQYLRTKCDRQLYLALHQPNDLEAAGLPLPMPARPGVGVLQQEGIAFENQRNDKLVSAFGAAVVFAKDGLGKAKPEGLGNLLSSVATLPAFVLQGKLEPRKLQSRILTNLGLPSAAQALIPPMSGLIPDIIVVRSSENGDEEVTAKGGRMPVPIGDTRQALVIIDVKHTSEANPSYSAEVALYAVVLANWLADTGKSAQYYVALNCSLWTRFKMGSSAFDAAVASVPKLPAATLLAELMKDCEDANLRFYLPTVLRFFREDLTRVIGIGDASVSGWRGLEWHVDSRCSSCDFLGYARWVPQDFKILLAAKPDNYCHPGAELTEHLSRIAGMTRGGRKMLGTAQVTKTSTIAVMAGNEPVYGKHTFLKREGAKLPARAKSLASNTLNVDSTALLATLAPWPLLSLSVAVNFDPSSGLLTGLGIGGSATAYKSGEKPLHWKHQGLVVDQKTLAAEWVELKAFLSLLSDYITQADAYVTKLGKASLTGQIAFWEERQYEELCNAVGRHLPKVLALADKKQRALAWMFPPDELLEKEAGAIPPCVVFVDELVRRVVFAPVAHVITLFDSAEHYHAGTYAPVERDAFYREFLTNGIPRERIYEIWSNEPEIQRGSVTKSRNTVISEYITSLSKQSDSIASVVERLRTDFRGSIKGGNPAINLSNPTGAQGVAFDAKMWIWWDKLAFATGKAEAHQRLALDAQTLEANYEALRLCNGVRQGKTNVWDFDVRASSAESKIEEGEGYLAIGLEGVPGFPLSSTKDQILGVPPPYAGDSVDLSMPLYSQLSAMVLTLDRMTLRAEVLITSRSQELLNYLIKHGFLNLQGGIFLTAGKSFFDWSKQSTEIFKCVGNPAIAKPDPVAAAAMALTLGKPGTGNVTPIAEVLWAAPSVQARVVMSAGEAKSLAVMAAKMHNLNPSQQDAVQHALERGLSIIWGPPGTGKTNTLAAYVQTVVAKAIASKTGIKILLSGPTYKAVEELVSRSLKMLDAEPMCTSDVFVCYSKNREHMQATTSQHLTFRTVEVDDQDYTNSCINSLGDSSRVTIVGTTVHQSHKFAKNLVGSAVAPVFDVVIIDESSQVPVTLAIAPMATLKKNARLVVAGDHLQMPPIAALEPPVGAEYLVGSIQGYLLKRPFGSPVSECPLLINYRSGKDIVDYARTIGYPAALIAEYPSTALRWVAAVPDPASGFPATLPWWQNLPSMVAPAPVVMTLLHDDDLSSQGNESEAEMVSSIVWALRASVSSELDGKNNPHVVHAAPTPTQFWEKSVGIVTPHRAQRALVVRELVKHFPTEAAMIDKAVDTVEKFQGGERHTIIVSFGVADADVIAGEEAFLMQMERTNVAVSRAQAKCIVIMPSSLAGHVPQDKKALLTAHAIKDYVDDFCNVEAPIVIQFSGGITRLGKLRYRT